MRKITEQLEPNIKKLEKLLEEMRAILDGNDEEKMEMPKMPNEDDMILILDDNQDISVGFVLNRSVEGEYFSISTYKGGCESANYDLCSILYWQLLQVVE